MSQFVPYSQLDSQINSCNEAENQTATQNETELENTQNNKEEEADMSSSKKCWFTPYSDNGKSDMDLTAEWCDQVGSAKVKLFASLTLNLNMKVKAQEHWFKWAFKLTDGTGEGNRDKIELTVSLEDMKTFKLAKRQGERKKIKIRTVEVFKYEALEPVFGDHLSACPLFLRESITHNDDLKNSPLLNDLNLAASPTESDSTAQYEQWEQRTPRVLGSKLLMGLDLEDEVLYKIVKYLEPVPQATARL
ncbi:hypothetical protein DFH28DRAFT_933343 [Melampsora americana]|nr:hypothetical protein DFH28DRAFT_933343 [Melampsora americana]